MKPILCITLNPAIDMTVSLESLTLGAVNRATSSQTHAAGKGLNAAQILADLGLDAVASGFLGADNDAIFNHLFHIRQTLAHSEGTGQVIDAFVKVPGITRTNIKLADLVDGMGRTTDINGLGFSVTETDKLEFFERIGTLAMQAQAVLISGSLAQGFELADFEHLLETLTKTHPRVAVDVSGEALKIALRYPLWLIKPNNDELFEIFGTRVDSLPEQLDLFDHIQTDIQNILISMGDQGVNWLRHAPNGRQVYQAKPPAMTVKSTVGAGDTLTAGMMFGLLQGHDPLDVLRVATALSAHAVSIVGFGVPKPVELERLCLLVQAEQLTH